MSIEAHKKLIVEFMKAFADTDYSTMTSLMTDDGTWTVPGQLPISGPHPKDEMVMLLEQMKEQFASPVEWVATGMIAEGDAVAVECYSSLDTTRGQEYRNRYHLIFRFRDGKISELIEYCDTKHVYDVFLAPS
ncbi:nuclear transport factor 2 family protein [Nocardia sp. NPDC004123]